VDLGFYLQLLLNGIVIGVIYALVAMGLSLIFGVLEIVNFAHGEFYMLGAMLAYFLTMHAGLGYWPTILVVTAVAVGLGYVLYEALLASLEGGGFVATNRYGRYDEKPFDAHDPLQIVVASLRNE